MHKVTNVDCRGMAAEIAAEYASELRRIIIGWRHREWSRLKRKIREATPEPTGGDEVADPMVRCAWMLCHAYGGPHHVGRVKFGTCEQWLEVSHYGDVSTIDSAVLTRLVFAAHEVAVRLEVGPGGARGLLLRLHPRARTPRTMTCHPTIDEAVDALRSRWAPCPVLIPSILETP